MTPAEPEALRVAFRVIDALEALGCRYQLGGSYASAIHGMPRQTHDVDLVAEIEPGHADALAERLGDAFYLDVDAIRAAIAGRRPFNLIHPRSGVRIDVFPKGEEPFDELELERSLVVELGDPPRSVAVKSAEDIVLRKLDWYRRGGEVSERQWRDVLDVLRVQGDRLDRGYLGQQADRLGLTRLLGAALGEVES